MSSLVIEGVFERFPRLKVAIIEGGFAWLPPLTWRLDKLYERMRSEVPHLKRRPSEYIREHIWVTTQPMEEPQDRQHVLEMMVVIGWTRLLFASDYRHWDFDDPFRAFPRPATGTYRQILAGQWAGGLSAGLRRGPMPRHVVARAADIPPGSRKLVKAGTRDIVIFNVKGELFALSDKCPHRGGSLSRGRLTGVVSSSGPGTYDYARPGEIIRCPLHGWDSTAHGRSFAIPTPAADDYAVSVEPGAKLSKGPCRRDVSGGGRRRLRRRRNEIGPGVSAPTCPWRRARWRRCPCARPRPGPAPP